MSTALDGRLIRHGRDDWRWLDGTPEPRVRDLSPSAHYNFRCRTYGTGGTHVEVLLSVAHRDRDVLGWVLDGIAEGLYVQERSGDHTGPPIIAEDGTLTRMMIQPGEDPLLGHEPIIHRRSIPRVALVPVGEWDAWAADHPIGAAWDMTDQDAILARARELGGTP